MKQNLLLIVLVISTSLLSDCSKEEVPAEDKYSLMNYDDSGDPFENTAYCFGKARNILGEGVSLYLLRAVQKDTMPHLDDDLNWMWYFIKDRLILEFDISKKIIIERETTELPMGCEYIADGDTRLNELLPVCAIWDSCTGKYNKPLLYVDIMIPLVFPQATMNYYFVSKDGIAYLGEDLFIYDASTGEDVTNN